jgi:nucleoside-diphosphate-sugar epimerase
MMEDRLVLQGCAGLPSNTIYVDNVAEAIVCALKAPAPVANGQAFVLSDGDELTWGEFYGYFADALGGGVIEEPTPKESTAGSTRFLPLRWIRNWLKGTRDILTSAELKALAKKTIQTAPYGYLPRLLLEKVPGLERWLRKKMGAEKATIYSRPHPGSGPIIRFKPQQGVIRTTRAQDILGYHPAVPRAHALDLTLQWVRHAGVIGN